MLESMDNVDLCVTWFSLIVVRHAPTEGSNLDLGFGSVRQLLWGFQALVPISA